MNIQREKTEQGIEERRAEKNGIENIESRKEQEKTEGTDNNIFWISRSKKHRKRGKIKNRVMYNNSSLHNQQNLCGGNTSRHTREELQDLEDYFLQSHLNLMTC